MGHDETPVLNFRVKFLEMVDVIDDTTRPIGSVKMSGSEIHTSDGTDWKKASNE